MADFTKKAIKASFVKLLDEKPLKQITVRDITEDCGVNRNTFYYHYQDIPQLLESIIKNDMDNILAGSTDAESLEDCLETIIRFALENRRAALHIYRSANRDLYEQYLWRLCEYVVTDYVDRQMKGRVVTEDDRRILVQYLKCVCFGLVQGWLEMGMKDDIRSDVHRLCEWKQGELEALMERISKPKE